MKFIPDLAKRILGIELICEFFVSGKSHRHFTLSFATDEHRSNTDKNNFSLNLRKSVSIRGSLRGLLHEFDRCAVGIAHVNDALAGIRADAERLRFAGSF